MERAADASDSVLGAGERRPRTTVQARAKSAALAAKTKGSVSNLNRMFSPSSNMFDDNIEKPTTNAMKTSVAPGTDHRRRLIERTATTAPASRVAPYANTRSHATWRASGAAVVASSPGGG